MGGRWTWELRKLANVPAVAEMLALIRPWKPPGPGASKVAAGSAFRTGNSDWLPRRCPGSMEQKVPMEADKDNRPPAAGKRRTWGQPRARPKTDAASCPSCDGSGTKPFGTRKKKWKFSLIVPGSKDGGCVYLDGRLLETQLSGQFTTTGPGHVVFLEKFLLQTSQLFTSEGSSVAAHWSRIVQRVASLNVLIGRFWNNKKKQENF